MEISSVQLPVCLLVGLCMVFLGVAAIVLAFLSWQRVGFERLNPRVTMRELIPASVLLVVGTQTIFSSFFLSILGLHRVADTDLATPAK